MNDTDHFSLDLTSNGENWLPHCPIVNHNSINRTSVFECIVLIDCFFHIVTNNLNPSVDKGGLFLHLVY